MMSSEARLAWKMAFRNLLRNKRRSISTGIAMTAGFVGLVLLSAYILRVQRGLMASTVYLNFKGHVSIYHKNGVDRFFARPNKYQISEDELSAVNHVLLKYQDQIEYTGHFISGAGLLNQNEKSAPVLVTGFEPEVYERSLNHPTMQKWAKDWIPRKDSKHDEFVKNPDLVSITETLGLILGKKQLTIFPSDPLENEVQLVARTYIGDLNAVNARLGIIHSTGISMAEATSLLAPIKVLQSLFDTRGVQYVALFLKHNGATKAQLVRDLQHEFQKQGLELEVYPFDSEKVSYFYVGTMGFLYVMASFFVLLILSAVVLSIANSLTMGILERSKEIGTLRALGFQAGFVRGLFVKEALWLSALSVVSGSGIASLIAQAVNSSRIMFSPPGVAGNIQFFLANDFVLLVVVAGVVFVTSTVTSYWVIRSRSQKKIIDLMSDTGA